MADAIVCEVSVHVIIMSKQLPFKRGVLPLSVLALCGLTLSLASAQNQSPQRDLRKHLAELTGSDAYRATLAAGLTRLLNNTGNGVFPGNATDYRTSLEKSPTGYTFRYDGDDVRVAWLWTAASGTLDDFQVQVNEGEIVLPAMGGGAYITTPAGEERLRGGKAVAVVPEGDKLLVVWRYPSEQGAIEISWLFRLHGKCLVVEADSKSAEITSFSLGQFDESSEQREIHVPYLHRAVSYFPMQNLFSLRLIDWTQSHSSSSPEHTAYYSQNTRGRRNRLHEVGYIAISPNVHEVLPNIPHSPSPYRELLSPLIVLDIWHHYNGTYSGDTDNLLLLKDYGVDHLAIIQHRWQRYGYDVKFPSLFPADQSYGEEADLIEFGKTATSLGMPWSLHENYIDIYPDSPLWDPKAVALQADGTWSKAWFNKSTGIQSYGIKCNRALDFAKANAPQMHARYGTTAGYLDVHTGVPPWHQLDHDATQPMAAMALHKVQQDPKLFQYLRDTHEGPLLGEGHKMLYWAGLFDGGEAQVEGGEDHAPLLDFELLKIHPQMVNHGMGYYVRWHRRGWGSRWGVDTGTPKELDKYRAQQIAYGHAGFIGREHYTHSDFIAKEHHLMHPIQRLMCNATPTDISYSVDGQWVTASVALATNASDRQRIKYDSGLCVWVNWNEKPWHVEGRTLPQWGFLALGPETEVWTAIHRGTIADFTSCSEYMYADARTSFDMSYTENTTSTEATADFREHLNPAGTKVDFGGIATDGAVKVSWDAKGLTVYPYPRETAFSVTIDLAFVYDRVTRGNKVSVRAIKALTGELLEEVPYTLRRDRLTFTVGTPGAGKFRVVWP